MLNPADIDEIKRDDKPNKKAKNKRDDSYEIKNSFEQSDHDHDEEMSCAPPNDTKQQNSYPDPYDNGQNRSPPMNNPYPLRSKKSNARSVNAVKYFQSNILSLPLYLFCHRNVH